MPRPYVLAAAKAGDDRADAGKRNQLGRFGSVISDAAASTYGLGIALCEYFGHVLDGNVPDAKMFRGWYQEAFAAARQRFRQAAQPSPSGGGSHG